MTAFAIIVATRDRAVALQRLLASAVAMTGWERLTPEIIVVDDGPSDAIRFVVADVARRTPGVRYLPVPAGGKSRALNRAIRATQARLLAFVDDDVELDAGWLVAVAAYASRAHFDAAQALSACRRRVRAILPSSPQSITGARFQAAISVRA